MSFPTTILAAPPRSAAGYRWRLGSMTGRIKLGASLILLASHLAFGQTAAALPQFEVASVKPAAPQGGIVRSTTGGDPGRVAYANVSLMGILARAFGVKSYQISGPSWLVSERYDVVAKIPDGSPKDQVPLMLQQLLNERFKLATHRETRELAVYALLLGKDGPKLGDAQDPTAAANAGRGVPRDGTALGSNGRLAATKISLTAFAEGVLSALAGRPVIDMTGIQGLYSFTMEYSLADPTGMRSGSASDGGPAPDGAPAPTIFNSLQQLGLKLEARKTPVEMLIVDHAEKVPTEN
jgi:uncharacterized protein (TIGR03435 family)